MRLEERGCGSTVRWEAEAEGRGNSYSAGKAGRRHKADAQLPGPATEREGNGKEVPLREARRGPQDGAVAGGCHVARVPAAGGGAGPRGQGDSPKQEIGTVNV